MKCPHQLMLNILPPWLPSKPRTSLFIANRKKYFFIYLRKQLRLKPTISLLKTISSGKRTFLRLNSPVNHKYAQVSQICYPFLKKKQEFMAFISRTNLSSGCYFLNSYFPLSSVTKHVNIFVQLSCKHLISCIKSF